MHQRDPGQTGLWGDRDVGSCTTTAPQRAPLGLMSLRAAKDVGGQETGEGWVGRRRWEPGQCGLLSACEVARSAKEQRTALKDAFIPRNMLPETGLIRTRSGLQFSCLFQGQAFKTDTFQKHICY